MPGVNQVPYVEGEDVLGATWDSCTFPTMLSAAHLKDGEGSQALEGAGEEEGAVGGTRMSVFVGGTRKVRAAADAGAVGTAGNAGGRDARADSAPPASRKAAELRRWIAADSLPLVATDAVRKHLGVEAEPNAVAVEHMPDAVAQVYKGMS